MAGTSRSGGRNKVPIEVKVKRGESVRGVGQAAALSVVQGYLNVFNLDPKSEMLTGVAIAMAITVLRIITTQPLIQK
jgi:hypothetical protein